MEKSHTKMKTAIAIVLSFLTFLLMWPFAGLMIAAAFHDLLALPEGGGDEKLTLIFALRLIGPAFGGFFAIWFPKYILKSVNLRVLYISFLAVVTLFGMFWILGNMLGSKFSGWEPAMFAAQYAAIFSGAYVGREPTVWKARFKGWFRRFFHLDSERQMEE